MSLAKNAVVVSEETPVGSVVSLNPEHLIAKALEHNVPVETLERLLSLRDRLKAEQGREAYFAALANFQAACPVVAKRKTVKNKDHSVRYSYAPLDDILEQVAPHLKSCGFSYSFTTEVLVDRVESTCLARHIAGHVENSSFSVPIDRDSFMNDAQKAASANTFSKRYAFCNAFGILTGDPDDDGKSLGTGASAQELYKRFAFTMRAAYEHHESIQLIKEACETGYLEPGAAAWFELPDDIKQTLWVAPTKGGPFTTEEREVIKSEAWRKAFYKDSPA
jgi:hypothetical protein